MTIKDKILSANDRRTETVEVPEWGLTLSLRQWSAKERIAFMQSVQGGKNMEAIAPRAVVMTVVDDEGHAVFTLDDMPALAEKCGQAVERVALAALRLNGLTADSIDQAKKN